MITPEALRKLLAQPEEPVLVVDVREADEVAEEPLLPVGERRYANVPLSLLRLLPQVELPGRWKALVLSGDMPLEKIRVIVSCRSGGRSSQAQALLAQVGIETENLEGGYLAWKA